jgi:phage gp29-like protein
VSVRGAITKDSAIIQRSEWLDNTRRYLTDSPSPASFANLLRRVDQNDVAALWELQEEMEEKSAHLQGVARTRRMAILATEWALEPNDSTAWGENVAKAVTSLVRRELEALEFNFLESIPTGGFDDVLAYMQLAQGPNICAAELLWRRGRLREVRPVPGTRLIRSAKEDLIGIETEEDHLGVPFSQWPGKFIVFTPQNRGPFPLRATLTHATCWPFLVARQCAIDWMAFNELHGSPDTIAKTRKWNQPEFRNKLKEMLEDRGANLRVVLPEDAEIQLLQASGEGNSYQACMEWAEKKLSILWLGQTLTTDTGGDVGSYAMAKVHENVRADLLLSDIAAERRMVECQILDPIVRMRFPGMDNPPIPRFVRQLPEARNAEEERLNMEQLQMARDIGLKVSQADAYEMLGLQRPKTSDELVGEVTP